MVKGTIEIHRTLTIEVEACVRCGVEFGLTAAYQQQRRNDHRNFYCPSGHEQHYVAQTEAERLAAELVRAQRVAADERAYATAMTDKLNVERRQHAATKGQLTKTRKRISAGVCPHCNRSFASLARHMQTQHKVEAAAARAEPWPAVSA